ncbi:hypothetical protein C0991_002003 [Blastosporella zonata]|nr:hypothetical protein C0991_002003 [Blastosporella zonata]
MEPIDAYLSKLPPSNVVAYHANGAVTLTYADSGASNHCFVNRADFTEYEPYTTPRQGLAANQGGVFNIMGRGTVKKTVNTDGRTSDQTALLLKVRRLEAKSVGMSMSSKLSTIALSKHFKKSSGTPLFPMLINMQKTIGNLSKH